MLGEFTVGDPTITGPAKVGVPLTWELPQAPGTASYVWRRGATPAAATAGYTPVAADLGASLVCDLTVARPGYEVATSSARVPVSEAPSPGRAGHTGRRASMPPYPRRRWPAAGKVHVWRTGATQVGSAAAYAVEPGDVGKVLTCVATAQRAGYEELLRPSSRPPPS